MLMARLGAHRRSSVQLDDGLAGRRVAGPWKGQRHDRLPIPPDVGEAIIGYLQQGDASTTTRTLFVTHRAPNAHSRTARS